jgi:pilus assembly protein Flp/PilA
MPQRSPGGCFTHPPVAKLGSTLQVYYDVLPGLQKSKTLFYNGKELTLSHFRQESNMLFFPHEEGQGLVEYALILVLVAVVVIAILTLLGPTIGNVFSNVIRQL